MMRLAGLAMSALFLTTAALAQQADQPALKGAAAFGDWRADRPGVRRLIKPEDLPKPYATKSASNGAGIVDMPADAKPRLPSGFSAELIASGIDNPRVVRVAPNGDLFVADSEANQIRVYRLTKDSAKPAENGIFAGGLNQPYGIAFYPLGNDPQWVYVASSDSIVRFAYRNGDLKASGGSQTIVDNIPANHHWTRDIAFSPDGKTLYLSVGSGSNVAENMGKRPRGGLDAWVKSKPLGASWGSEAGRAEVRAFDPDGKNGRVVATGLRNCSGMTVQPATGAPWCVVNERDALGDNVPAEYATSVREGAFYGWPWYYIGNNEDPRHKGERPDLAGKADIPDVLMQAHSAPLNIAFYDGKSFPEEYRGDAFVTLHGSWNRGNRTGYKIVRLLFKDGKPTGEYEDFMTGFVASNGEVWGRPVGVAVAGDGSLIVSEDGNGTIWRVTYNGGRS
ncbi:MULTISPECIES: sorbosone dehydrogenase family protein [unclassified Mesorhizobium]|uniref:PQQ-dependent sugar dehydrogenase n=1 Tax=unclassified Mesorhizobium TaxID=325217 RepID=UPI000FDACA28|nr:MULTISPECIES: sorbosone dehydrogenase family protein [unclassified Mesorhizobium]TGR42835.1 sorbosone dehydrogenase family protein [bacterium M00.F.Ca.ET.199.01.1.1]TGU29994.1 sorbosone dehydrogenase family protein [bacterium M00.F.Ca.ET.156.01.1.1]TGV84722.1 sorbosone dehydrogenase family protein [Mesorhizobium sp. M00.F.Ca.ET.149.01.1.1]TGR24084.1 sorbosone dehydrogenase family protein [Mesorhizobium sp. M8A.F.Ca.ET.202.01.1.1]TGR27041.1 sorbosone dehydrogenase family protein [Mesorhizobi